MAEIPFSDDWLEVLVGIQLTGSLPQRPTSRDPSPKNTTVYIWILTKPFGGKDKKDKKHKKDGRVLVSLSKYPISIHLYQKSS